MDSIRPNYGSEPAIASPPYDDDTLARMRIDAAEIVGRYPEKRSALLPLLHLVQSIDGYVTTSGIEFCAQTLGLSGAEVSGVATFYTQYKRFPNGEYTVGVCTNTLCAIMGGDAIWEAVSSHLGIGHDETTPDGKVTLERLECNAACDYAPVVMGNWEFFDNQTPESTIALVDSLRAGRDVRPTRGSDKLATFKEISRVLAGFTDGRANEGPGAGEASLRGLKLAQEMGWDAPTSEQEEPTSAAGPAQGEGPLTRGRTSSADTPANAPDEKPGDGKVG